MNNSGKSEKRRFTLLFIFSVLLTLLATAAIEVVLWFILLRVGVFKLIDDNPALYIALMFIAGSVIIGSFVSIIFSRFILKPINILVDGINNLAKGKYDTRVEIGKNRVAKSLGESFNILANELQNTEMLRSDFTNNFSHEFKTPIVSVYGFAKILNKGNVPEEKQKEYLNIIEKESERLSSMATNVLNLTKLENQNILSSKNKFNLSEQIRTCFLLLEKKWTAKNLNPVLDFGEYMINANEEMLKQVWINLIDNAVKFATPDTDLEITIAEADGTLSVTVSDFGKEIPEDQLDKIFNKFYQTDSSHATEGNGIGLSIVKKVVTLHDGTVTAQSANGKTAFTVKLKTI